jgi:molecular chaperone Hsp33
MKEAARLGEVSIRRLYHRQRQAVLAEGRFHGFFTAYLDHVRRWEIDIDDLSYAMMRQGLAAMTLHSSFRPADESMGFTINFRDPPVNIFLTGDAARQAVTGRAFIEGVKTAEKSRLFVQSQRPGSEQVQSLIEVSGLDVLEVFEQYYARSEQAPARFFESRDECFSMLLGLPDSDREWITALSADQVEGLKTEASDLDERTFRFQCGCSPKRMLSMLGTIYGQKPEELFGKASGMETFCPRCGSRWWIDKKDYRTEG